MVIGNNGGHLVIFNQTSRTGLTFDKTINAHGDLVFRIIQSPFTPNYVATCSSDKTVKVWDTKYDKWDLIKTMTYTAPVEAAVEWLNADTLASGAVENGKGIQIWSLSTGQTKTQINIPNNYVLCLKLLNDKIHLAAGFDNGDINIYNYNDKTVFSTLKGHQEMVRDLLQISDNLLASSSFDKNVRIWDLTTNSCKFILQGHISYVYGLKLITPDLLASGSYDQKIKLWNLKDGTENRTLVGHSGVINLAVDLINNGQTLISGSRDKTIKLWDWKTGECLNTFTTPTNLEIRSLTFL